MKWNCTGNPAGLRYATKWYMDAAHAPVGFCFSISWGLGVPRCPCQTAFLFNSNGDSITISNELVNSGKSIAKAGRMLKFAVPHIYSSHHFLLRQWLNPFGVKAGKDFEIVVLPPSLMAPSLAEGFIDGFCVGEPFGSIAVNQKAGVIMKESADLSPLHPEKALLVTDAFAQEREEQHLKMIAALSKAGKVCDTTEGRKEAAEILSRPEYLNMDSSIIGQSLFPGIDSMKSEDFHLFNRGVNEPTKDKANWVVNHMKSAGLIPDSIPKNDMKLGNFFRNDTYKKATSLAENTKKKTPRDLPVNSAAIS
ncbi:MAG: ABC transporter substrate-binding protein [Verrucomicrobiales bacterium]|nr:ABC transporter substrate-binding protein [Verrucomicrobiales bacterium]